MILFVYAIQTTAVLVSCATYMLWRSHHLQEIAASLLHSEMIPGCSYKADRLRLLASYGNRRPRGCLSLQLCHLNGAKSALSAGFLSPLYVVSCSIWGCLSVTCWFES